MLRAGNVLSSKANPGKSASMNRRIPDADSVVPALAWDAVTLDFPGGRRLDSVSLSVPPGARIAIGGPSGSGKSSLLLAVLGFREVSAGEIRVEGTAITPASAWTLRRRIAWVPQEPPVDGTSAREFLARPFRLKANRAASPSGQELRAVLEELALPPGILEQDADRLSGGEKQRLALARALLLQRPILLLDEPDSALDPGSVAALRRALLRRTRLTIAAVSHVPERLDCWDRVETLPAPGEDA